MQIFNFKKKKKKTKKRVLIIEDDALLLTALSEKFTSEKFEILSEVNGLKALDAVTEFNPDVILLDLILPGLDGFAVLKNLKSNDKMKDIPVVVISNLSHSSDIKSAKVLGAEEYFIKANTRLDEIIGFVKKKYG